MVDINSVNIEIRRKHEKEYGGGHSIKVGGDWKNPKKISAQLILDNPEVLRKMKNPFPFEGELLSAPDMPDVVKKLIDTTSKEKKETKPSKDKVEDIPKLKYVKKEESYSKEDLNKMSFSKLKELAEKFGETGRSKSGLIKDILKHIQ